MARITLIIASLCLAILNCSCARSPYQRMKVAGGEAFRLEAPGGQVELKVLVDNGQLKYSVSRGGAAVIETSPLVFTVDGVNLADGVRAGRAGSYRGKEPYATRGVHAQAVDLHNGWTCALRHEKSGTAFTLEARAFADGIAYRFVLPQQKPWARVPDERSAFVLPHGSTIWYHGMRGHYEGDYVQRDVAEVPAGEWVAPPLTVKLPNGRGYALISESNLVNYSGFALEADGKRGFIIGLAHRQPVSYPYELRYSKADIARLSKPARIEGEITTPWRVVVVAPDLNALVNSDVITHLAPPPPKILFPQGLATKWVKPGRAVWQYLDRPDQSASPADPLAAPATARAPAPARVTAAAAPTTRATTRPRRSTTPDDMKTFSRLAGELGFEYNVLEGFWQRWGDEQLRDLVEYSEKQGVGLFVWVHSRDLYNPRNRELLFTRLRATGVKGLKVDFFDHEHKEVIDLYHTLLREGAQNKILFDFHGANKPAGESRTYPNELVREAVRGMEASKLKERARHNVTLPFTRYVVGPAEYTPVHFGERRGDTTFAHQIATAAVFTAPLLTYGAHPQRMLDSPARDMIKSIPSTWDETRVLPPSEIGQVAVMARRKGKTWFLAVINGPEARRIVVPPLSFLAEGKYRAMVVRDDLKNPAAVDVQRDVAVSRDQAMELELASGGGFIARLDKE